jgi:hypothetical protein
MYGLQTTEMSQRPGYKTQRTKPMKETYTKNTGKKKARAIPKKTMTMV